MILVGGFNGIAGITWVVGMMTIRGKLVVGEIMSVVRACFVCWSNGVATLLVNANHFCNGAIAQEIIDEKVERKPNEVQYHSFARFVG